MAGEKLTKAAQIALEDSHGSVKGYFITVREPGRDPIKKRPPTPTWAGALEMLLELLQHKPNAEVMLLSQTWNDDLWVDDGVGQLVEAAFVGALKLPDGSTISLRCSHAGWTVWGKQPGQRRPRKWSGPHAGSRAAIVAVARQRAALTKGAGE